MITKYNVILKFHEGQQWNSPLSISPDQVLQQTWNEAYKTEAAAAARGENGTDKTNAQYCYLWAISIGSKHLGHKPQQ